MASSSFVKDLLTKVCIRIIVMDVYHPKVCEVLILSIFYYEIETVHVNFQTALFKIQC